LKIKGNLIGMWQARGSAMKTPIVLLSLGLIAPAMAGVTEVTQPQYHDPAPREWSWFAGASVGYLFDYKEPMYSLNAGVSSPWSPLGWNASFSLEIGLIEDDNESEIPFHVEDADVDLQLVPVFANVKFERRFGDSFGLYFGVGAGAVFSEVIVDQSYRDQDTVFAAQAFAGASFHFGDHSEVYVGGRWIHFDDTENYDLTQDWAAEIGYRFHF
jgi:opacity protein-like surface antigen